MQAIHFIANYTHLMIPKNQLILYTSNRPTDQLKTCIPYCNQMGYVHNFPHYVHTSHDTLHIFSTAEYNNILLKSVGCFSLGLQ